jgi:glycosyltransferase involved in cell wall biosynthesis
MRILVVSSHEQMFGGGEGRLAYEFAVEMSKLHEVVLMYPGRAPESLPAGAHLTVYTIRSIDYTLPALSGGEIRAVLRFLDTFKPEAVHSHTPWFVGSWVQAWARARGVPFYYTAHELPSKMLDWGLVRYMSGFLRSGILHKLTSTYLVSFCRHCTGVVALNSFAYKDIRAVGYRGRLFVIPNGRTLALYDGKAPADLGSAQKILTFAGDFNPRKNQKFLVSMLAHLPPDYRLVLIGHEVDHQYRREIEAIMDADLKARVRFTGRLDHAKVPGELARTHLWVSASLMEVQSLAVMEALASGTPVLGLSNETIDELVDAEVGGRLPKGTSPEAFAAAVRALCETDQARYAAMCAKARERAKPYDWDNTMRATVRMYESSSRGVGSTRRGTMAMPLLLATAQMFISLVAYIILRTGTAFSRMSLARKTRVEAAKAERVEA